MSWNIRMLILNRFLCEFNCFMWAGICFCNKFKKAYTLITIDMKLINFSPNLIFYLTVSCQFVHGTTNHTKTLWPFYPYWSQRLMKLNWNFLQTLPVIIFHQSFNLLGQVKFPKYRNEEREKKNKIDRDRYIFGINRWTDFNLQIETIFTGVFKQIPLLIVWPR